jgi:hypothetical protein
MATKTQVKSLMKAHDFFSSEMDETLQIPLNWVREELDKAKKAVSSIKGYPEAKSRANLAIMQCQSDLERMSKRISKVGEHINKEINWAWEDHPEWGDSL